ncbi:hypothetical protein H632_c582p0 [Helicosporidium sp. ATCC 50920]|nr:hypothetical protein H632_c582p0 [Helicosporidium sp. ATCC 50920]|eukprot:KDD75630.1 hypothetical protein H632_c582p0 [Helicosporidium sp. ATCC 50920]
MVTKRLNVFKHLAKTLSQWPPAHVAPFVRPNFKLRRVIEDNIAGRLTETVENAEKAIFEQWQKKQGQLKS